MRRFFLGLWVLTGIAHAVFFAALAEALARLAIPGAPWIALAAALVLFAAFRDRVDLVRHDRPISPARRAFELLYFAHWCGAIAATFLAVAGGAGLLLAMVVARIAGRTLPPLGDALFLAAYGAGLAVGLYGVLYRARRAVVRTIDVEVRGLDPAFDGYRIVQLSDLHIGSLFGRGASARWVRSANALAPDLIALTGDYVTNGTRFHEEIARVLAELRARDAVIATLGNHDYFGGGEPLATLLRERGVVLLRNARHTVHRSAPRSVGPSAPSGAPSIEIAGVDDTWTRSADIDRTLRGFDASRPLIGLTHDPSMFPDFARRGAALVLAGHTHWGQVGVPFAAERENLAKRVFRFSAGLYREGGSVLYVNAGLGTTGPPIRLGSAPEITLLILRAA